MAEKKPEKPLDPAAAKTAQLMQVTVNPAVTARLQRLQIKVASTKLMIAELEETINNTLTSLVLEIKKLQTENKSLKEQLKKKKPADQE